MSIEVDVIVSGRNSSIEIPFDVKWRFDGISIFYNLEGEVDWWETFRKIKLLKFLNDTKLNVSDYDLVISDYEPVSCWAARRHKINCIGLSNQYSLFYKEGLTFRQKMLNLFSRYFTPCDKYIGLDYKSIDKNVFLPIVSNKFIKINPLNKKFILIYLPSYKLTNLLRIIVEFRHLRWIVYSDEVKQDIVVKNIFIKKINREKFQNDLINCEGVITASGFSTTSEALVLNKKLWSIPLKFHTEQKINSDSLSELGVFTGEFTKNNILKWIFRFNKIEYNWKNPIDDIINHILNIYKK